MSKKWTLNEAFAHFGAVPANPRWSWSARSSDGHTVVITLWQDHLSMNKVTKQALYDVRGKSIDVWSDTPGNRERLENLKWAKHRCDGLFRAVITVAKDTKAVPRAIAECFPHEKLLMRITDLNEETGEFCAVSVTQ